MNTYIADQLDWPNRFEEFSEAEQRLLLALSHAKWRWRTEGGLQNATGLTRDEVQRTLARLIRQNLVRPTFGGNAEIVYGLSERVEPDKIAG